MKNFCQWLGLWIVLFSSGMLISIVIPFLVSSSSTGLVILGIFILPLSFVIFLGSLREIIKKGKKLFLKEIDK